MKLKAIAIIICVLSVCGGARADDADALRQRISDLESKLKELSARIDDLGPTSAPRQVRVVDPVFIGSGSGRPSPLGMDDPTINCPAHSFVTAIQVLKTGNTVSQIRYACRGI